MVSMPLLPCFTHPRGHVRWLPSCLCPLARDRPGEVWLHYDCAVCQAAVMQFNLHWDRCDVDNWMLADCAPQTLTLTPNRTWGRLMTNRRWSPPHHHTLACASTGGIAETRHANLNTSAWGANHPEQDTYLPMPADGLAFLSGFCGIPRGKEAAMIPRIEHACSCVAIPVRAKQS